MKKKLLLVIGIIVIAIAAMTSLLSRDTQEPQLPELPQETESLPTYTIQSQRNGQAYIFSIVNEQGSVQTNFTRTHTELMHVIVVRNDLSSFQHLHPTYDQATGVFTVADLTFPADGTYRIFADFALESLPMTLYEDIQIGDTNKTQPLGTEEHTKTFGDIQVALKTHDPLTTGREEMLMFQLSENEKPVTDLEPYLGALGHTIVLKEKTLEFVHAHPMTSGPQTGSVDFMVPFPEAGRYKVFTQFKRNGQVFLTDFVVSVQ